MSLRYFIIVIITVVSTVCFAQNSASYKEKNISVPKDSTVTIKIDSPKVIDANILFCHVKNPDNSSQFDIIFCDNTVTDGYKLSFTWNKAKYASFEDDRIMQVNIIDIHQDSIVDRAEINCANIADLYRGNNQLSISGNFHSGLNIYLNKRITLAKLPWKKNLRLFQFCSGIGSIIKIFKANIIKDNTPELETGLTIEDIRRVVRYSNDSIVGVYRYLDRENNPKLAVPGGKYTLAILPARDGNYDIIYIDGAKTYKKCWHTGMLKGRLLKTIFVNHFDLEWYNSKMDLMKDETFASLQMLEIFEVNFPLYKAKMRFSRVKDF
ncbi:MAG: hypothetical protein ACI30S_08660 [Muribaculaceae bacterium]